MAWQKNDVHFDDELLGQTDVMVDLRSRIQVIASCDEPVLITGETGVGKDLIARAIHRASQRRGARLHAINCAAFPDTLLEAELFGHASGAFTGADKQRVGCFRSADKSTLFLDEVGEMSPSAQAKLLRVLSDGVVQPLGTDEAVRVDVRILSATNVDLREKIAERQFRDDLFYRLKLFHLHVPPLRERRGDIVILVDSFLTELQKADDEPVALTKEAWTVLQHYAFPGNVRELRYAIRHAFVMGQGRTIDVSHFPDEIRGQSTRGQATDSVVPLAQAQALFERDYIQRVLAVAAGNRTHAAKLLGISRKTLWAKLKNHVADRA